jgi:hypothetical protein
MTIILILVANNSYCTQSADTKNIYDSIHVSKKAKDLQKGLENCNLHHSEL